MVTYIKRSVPGYIFETEEVLSPELFDNIGQTYEDFLTGSFVLLNEAQVEFHKEHPEASVEEVWNMEIRPVPERTAEQARAEMLMKINEYDVSENVNDFTINGAIHAWFTPAERTNYSLSISAAKLLAQDTLVFAVGENVLQVKTEDAEKMLAAIQLYADGCYMVTKQHQLAVANLTSVEEIDSFDYTAGYPEKLNFNLL